ncbi:MAG: protein-export chaperone SecB [Selenomonadaceae bacterium]|nr:protein-export chaperone SecB [Selenomonadaceae bacterium]
MNRDNPEYQEYKMARDSIQLRNAYVFRSKAERISDLYSGERVEFKFWLGHQKKFISEKEWRGCIKVDVIVTVKESQREIAKLSVECAGIFLITDDSLDSAEAEERVNLQITPQLLPYARNALTAMSSIMNIPPVILPTMDIIKSIKNNR